MIDKTMDELKVAIDAGLVEKMWGTTSRVYAVVQNRDTVVHVLETWKVAL